MNNDTRIINATGCDRTSTVYLNSFNFLQPIMLNDDATITIGAMTIRLNEADGMDLSALGVYIGKIVEQEINSSVVQLMRECVGIEMPTYYCKYCPETKAGDDIVKTRYKDIRLNSMMGYKNKTLQTIPLGDAYFALETLQDETPLYFEDFSWLKDNRFLEAWRKLNFFRNKNAHTGVIVTKEQMKENVRYFNNFIEFMPNILELKRKLSPDGMFDVENTEGTQNIELLKEQPFEKTIAVTDRPDDRPSLELAREYARMLPEINKMEECNLTQEEEDNFYSITHNYNLNAYVFEENGKKGMRDILGNVLIPALYDEIGYEWNTLMQSLTVNVAIRDDKWGLVKIDGSGEEVTEFKYRLIQPMSKMFLSNMFFYKIEGCDAFGILLSNGKEFTPCIIDECYEPSTYFYFRVGEYWGFWDGMSTRFEACYDNIEVDDPEEPTIFTLNGIIGYVTWDGDFIPKSDVDALEDECEIHDRKLDFVREMVD